MKTKIEIKSIFGSVLFSFEKEDNTVKDTLLEAIKSGADLRCADLSDADLSDADLRGADLRDAYLRGADFRGADLSGADLSGADLRCANLSGADLSGVNLSCANLSDANLSGANLSGADLSGVKLCDADFRGAYLRDADLRDAYLRGADFRGADYNELTAFLFSQCPSEGSFIGWKKSGSNIIKLLITETSKRSSATTLKCRCSEAKVLEIQNLDGTKSDIESVASGYDADFIYKVGEISRVDNFDENRWEECSTGIHFFISREMAVKY